MLYSIPGWSGEIFYRYIDGQFQHMKYIMNSTFYNDSQGRLILKATDSYTERYEQFFHVTFTYDSMDYTYLGTWRGEWDSDENPHLFENEELTLIHSLFELEEDIINNMRSSLGMADTAVPWFHWSAVTWTEITPPSYTEEGLKITQCIDCGMIIQTQIIPMLREESEESGETEEIAETKESEEADEEEYEETQENIETAEIEIIPAPAQNNSNNSSWRSRITITFSLVILLGAVLLYQQIKR
jgi:hypothetical protein